MAMNQMVLKTKHTDLEKSVSLILETQAKMQEGLNQLLMGNATPQFRSSILGSPPITQNRGRGTPPLNPPSLNNQSDWQQVLSELPHIEEHEANSGQRETRGSNWKSQRLELPAFFGGNQEGWIL